MYSPYISIMYLFALDPQNCPLNHQIYSAFKKHLHLCDVLVFCIFVTLACFSFRTNFNIRQR